MKLGLSFINARAVASPEKVVQLARGAEEIGLESLWTFEHVVLSSMPTERGPYRGMPILDPLIALSFAAAVTERVRLATGVLVLPLHEPVALSKRVASLDVLSGGRVILGIGTGYYEPEFDAVGVPLAGRGHRADEYLAAMRVLWSSGPAKYEGSVVSFREVEAHPRPIQGADIPVVVGGRSPLAYRRAVTQATGWYGFALDVEQAGWCIQDLKRMVGELPRPDSLGALEISVATPDLPDERLVDAYAGLGVSRLTVPIPDEPSASALAGFFDRLHQLRQYADDI